MGFQVHTRETGRVVVVEAVGKLTLTDGAIELRDIIHVFAANGTTRFVLNLARVEFIDSYGIGELVRSYGRAKKPYFSGTQKRRRMKLRARNAKRRHK